MEAGSWERESKCTKLSCFHTQTWGKCQDWIKSSSLNWTHPLNLTATCRLCNPQPLRKSLNPSLFRFSQCGKRELAGLLYVLRARASFMCWCIAVATEYAFSTSIINNLSGRWHHLATHKRTNLCSMWAAPCTNPPIHMGLRDLGAEANGEQGLPRASRDQPVVQYRNFKILKWGK